MPCTPSKHYPLILTHWKKNHLPSAPESCKEGASQKWYAASLGSKLRLVKKISTAAMKSWKMDAFEGTMTRQVYGPINSHGHSVHVIKHGFPAGTSVRICERDFEYEGDITRQVQWSHQTNTRTRPLGTTPLQRDVVRSRLKVVVAILEICGNGKFASTSERLSSSC